MTTLQKLPKVRKIVKSYEKLAKLSQSCQRNSKSYEMLPKDYQKLPKVIQSWQKLPKVTGKLSNTKVTNFLQFCLVHTICLPYGCPPWISPYGLSNVWFVCRPKLLCNASSAILFWAFAIDHLYHQGPVARWRQGHLVVTAKFPRGTSDF